MEPDLVSDLAADVHGAFPALVGAMSGPVYSVAVRLCGRNEAEDIAQETFVRAYKALVDYDPDRRLALQLRPWVLTITLNVARNQLRSASRHPTTAPEDGTEPETATVARAIAPEVAAERSELHAHLASALLRLPLPTREAVVLRHVVGCRTAEVAAILDRPQGTVKAQVSRGLAALREDLQHDPLLSEENWT